MEMHQSLCSELSAGIMASEPRSRVANDTRLHFSLVEGFYNFWSFLGSGRPWGPRIPLQRVGSFAPHLSEGSPATQTPKMTDFQSLYNYRFFVTKPKCSHGLVGMASGLD